MNKLSGVSIVIRALNEEKLLHKVLCAINLQKSTFDIEVIIVDSGSTDRTQEIAIENGCKLMHISPREFTFGRALNLGVSEAQNDVIVSLSSHCIPYGNEWLNDLVDPIFKGKAQIVFGRQKAHSKSRTSERNYFKQKYSLNDGYCMKPLMNNGNAAFIKILWNARKFNESIEAQEDLDFCRWHQVNSGALLWFTGSAIVEHYHNDTNKKLYKRLSTELYTEYKLGFISLIDMTNFLSRLPRLIHEDIVLAKSRGALIRALVGIITFRCIQAYSWVFAYLKVIFYRGQKN